MVETGVGCAGCNLHPRSIAKRHDEMPWAKLVGQIAHAYGK